MSWDFIFAGANGLALLMWAVLILLPRGEVVRAVVFYGGTGLLCLAYAVLLGLLLGGVIDTGAAERAGPVNFTTIEGIRTIFRSDGGAVIGWIHYLALDLFVGQWIARDADAKGFSRLLQAPLLLLTLLAGPAGLLLWLVVREPAARRAAPRRRFR